MAWYGDGAAFYLRYFFFCFLFRCSRLFFCGLYFFLLHHSTNQRHGNNGTSPVRIDATGMNKASGTSAHVRFSVTHDDLEQCVGLATAAFALELMNPAASSPTPNTLPPGAFSSKEVDTNTANSIPPGIYFPSELPPVSRQAILGRVKGDASVWELEVNTSQANG